MSLHLHFQTVRSRIRVWFLVCTCSSRKLVPYYTLSMIASVRFNDGKCWRSDNFVRKAQQAVGVSYGSVHRETKKLKLYPYKFHVIHEHLPTDPARRMAYCTWYRQFTRNDIARFDIVSFSHEAWFSLNAYVNSQNYR